MWGEPRGCVTYRDSWPLHSIPTQRTVLVLVAVELVVLVVEVVVEVGLVCHYVT